MRALLNRIKFQITFFFILIFPLSVKGQHGAKYWVQFADKNQVPYSINEPGQFLSSRAIQRRIKNSVSITVEDLPVSSVYIDSLKKTGIKVMYASKWFNSVTIEVSNDSVMDIIKNFSFIKAVEQTADPLNYKNYFFSDKNNLELGPVISQQQSEYGYGYKQINLENGIPLHEMGFRGQGVYIAIIDVGFHDADKYVSLAAIRNENRVVSTKNFVDIGESVYNSQTHGAAVFSVIGANLPEDFIGTSPDASFILLCSEDGNSEYPVEEDNWVAAAEYADSLGADIITTSLGYTTFDNAIYDHSYEDLNGESSRMSIAESIAASKGMIVINSAGNEGSNFWHYISIPADAKNILAIGATKSDGSKASFSSFGPTYDGRVKPDIMAMGQSVSVEGSIGSYSTANGTSLSSPIIAGLTACLVQAFPTIKGNDIVNAIILSANNCNTPNNSYGYGIPNYGDAYDILNNYIKKPDNSIWIYPNPFINYLVLNTKLADVESIKIKCYNVTGRLIFETNKPGGSFVVLQSEIQNLKEGLYFFRCFANNQSWIFKAFKY